MRESKGNNLVERVNARLSEPALIQNGNDPEVFSTSGVSNHLVERASANEPALIQNGNDPGAFSTSGASREV